MTSYTVTATNSNGDNGIDLQVEVITGATEAGGAHLEIDNGIVNGTGAGTAFTGSLTPVSTGSFIAWAASDAEGTATGVVAAANNKLLTVAANTDSFQDTANGFAAGAGYYSGTVTSGSGVTVGSSNTAGGAAPQLAVYEIQPSGGAWAEDASTPAWVKVTGSNAATTASFTPPAGGAVLAAIVTCNFGSSNTGNKITVSSSPSLTWTLRASNSLQANNGGVAIYTATVAATITSGPALPQQYMGSRPAVVVSGAGWRGANHSR